MKRGTVIVLLMLSLAGQSARSQSDAVQFVVLGDSIGEGVQSGDASIRTQPFSYFKLIAEQMRVPSPLPLINTSPTGSVGSAGNRTRINPSLAALNLAVSGSTVHDLLNERFVPPVDTETDLVLMPRTGSQIEIAEQLRSRFHAVWIGNNDVLGAVLDWDNLDAEPMTSLVDFTADYSEMIRRLGALGTRVVVGTIPDVSRISFLFSREDLVRFVGSDFGLPQGSFTSLPVALLLKLELDDGGLIQDPNYVLDPQEAAAIQTRTNEINQVITQTATTAGMAVGDISAHFLALAQNPPVFHGLALTLDFQGGLFSLDAIHPTNIGQALAANVLIQAANMQYGMQIPLISETVLSQIAASDPFIDWNGNLKVRGRPLAGLLETLGPVVGISGDFNEGPGSSRTTAISKTDKRLGEAFKQQYVLWKGQPASTIWRRNDAIAAMKEIFGS